VSTYSIDPNNPTANGTLTFDDEFSNNHLSLYTDATKSGIWSTDWWYRDGYPTLSNTLTGNGEQEWYINANDTATTSVVPWTVSNGVLNIQAAATPSNLSSAVQGSLYTSGMLNTYHSFSQTYGLFEAKMKLPAGQGLWPAFWLLNENGQWPPEIDVMENLGNNTNTAYTTVHSSTLTNGYEALADPVNNTTAWHTYAVDWEPDYTTFYIDGKLVDKVATPSDMNSPMYMILNLAVGGYWPGDANSSTPLPANMQVAWVKAYESDANLTAGQKITVVGDGGAAGSTQTVGKGGGNFDPTGGATVGTVASVNGNVDAHNFLGDGHAGVLMENAAGATAVGEVQNNALAYTTVGGLGPEWTFGGTGDFLSKGFTQYLIENTAGELAVADAQWGQAEYAQVGQIGPEWTLHGAGTYLGDGKSQFLMENTAGQVAVGEVGSNGQATYTFVAALGPEWKIVGSGDFLGLTQTHDQFLIENTNGTVDVATVGSNGQTTYTTVAGLGSEWKFVGAGDYLGVGRDQFLIENTAGAVAIGSVGSGAVTTYTTVAGLGPEWKVIGSSDLKGEGHAQFQIENTAGTIVNADVSGGAAHYTTIGGVGQEWSFHM
jgi:beta-glucanase (GH16 family)